MSQTNQQNNEDKFEEFLIERAKILLGEMEYPLWSFQKGKRLVREIIEAYKSEFENEKSKISRVDSCRPVHRAQPPGGPNTWLSIFLSWKRHNIFSPGRQRRITLYEYGVEPLQSRWFCRHKEDHC